MTPFGWIFITFTIVIMCFTFLFKRYGKFWLISIPATFMFIYTIFNVLGANYLCSHYQYHELKYIIAINLGVIIHTLGFVLTDHIFKFNFKTEMKEFINKPIINEKDRIYKLLFSCVILVIVIVTVIYLKMLDSIPIVELLNSSSKALELAKTREIATTTFAGKYHRYSFFFKMILPYFSLVAMAATYKNRDKFWKISFISLFVFTCFMLIVDIQKAPLLFYLISVIYLLYVLNKKVDVKKLIFVGMGFIVILIFMYLFIMGFAGRGMGVVFTKISMRLFIGQTKGVYTAFKVFPVHHDFLYGLSFPNPGGFFPYETFELIKYIFKEMYGYGRFIVGTAPTPYFVEFYVNFGYIAMIVSMLIGSFLIQLAQIIFIRSQKSIINLGLYAFLLISIGKLGLMSLLHTFGIKFFMLILFVGIYKITVNSARKINFETSNA